MSISDLYGQKRGISGQNVERLQRILLTKQQEAPHFFPHPISVTGVFDDATHENLVAFQYHNSLSDTSGVFNIETAEALYKRVTPMPQSLVAQINTISGDNALLQAKLRAIFPNSSNPPLVVDGYLNMETLWLARDFIIETNFNTNTYLSFSLDNAFMSALDNAVRAKINGNIYGYVNKYTYIEQSTTANCAIACMAMMTGKKEADVLQKVQDEGGKALRKHVIGEERRTLQQVLGGEPRYREMYNPKKGLEVGIYNKASVSENIGHAFGKADPLSLDNFHVKHGDVEQVFANMFHLKYHHFIPPKHWSVSELKTTITNSPMMFSTIYKNYIPLEKRDSFRWGAGVSPSGHWRLIIGIITDEHRSGKGTDFLIADPWNSDWGTFSGGYGGLYFMSYEKLFGPNPELPMEGIITK